jgi:asparagine synthetase B (glutamine-hydrolysing)
MSLRVSLWLRAERSSCGERWAVTSAIQTPVRRCMTPTVQEAAVGAALERHASMAVAVSGGVDSMVLAFLAHRLPRLSATMFHAVSPAVPGSTTARVRRFA